VATAATIDLGESTQLVGRFAHGSGQVDQAVGAIGSGHVMQVKPKATTTYTLTVTNAAKRATTAEATVVVKPGLEITFVDGLEAPAAVTVTGPSGFSRVLSGSALFKGLEPGQYLVKASPFVQDGKQYHPLRPAQAFDVTTGTSVQVEFAAADLTVALPGGVPMAFVLIKPGTFAMGSEEDLEVPGWLKEKPVHVVTLAKPFYMARFVTTQAQWEAVASELPKSWGELAQGPVRSVSYGDIQTQFLLKLNQAVPGYGFRLPSEAEWEYACRAGTTTRFFFGTQFKDLEETWATYAWRDSNYAHPVGEKWANPWGLYDLAGLGLQWCEDVAQDGYLGAPTDGSPWLAPLAGEMPIKRVLRGRGPGGLLGFTSQRVAEPQNERQIPFTFRVVASASNN
jgi:formylglycine-generating enzyme required for sulfatase activity